MELYKTAVKRQQDRELKDLQSLNEKRERYIAFKKVLIYMVTNCDFKLQTKAQNLLKEQIKMCLVSNNRKMAKDEDISNISINIMGI